jgi:hypothetical protein
MAFVYIIPLVLGDWYLRRDERKLKISQLFIYAIFLILLINGIGEEKSFIYFVF